MGKCNFEMLTPQLNSFRKAPVVEVFPTWPRFEDDEIEAVMAVLRSGKVNRWTGNQNELFEKEFAEYVGCRCAVALANGSLALELALLALGIGPGDEVIVPSRTFIATGSSVARCGATPVFADVDRVSQNLTEETILNALSNRTKAIIVVHLAGWPCDMDPIMDLAKAHGLKVVEDCAQAHGATYKGRPVGSIGHVAAFSFCQDKIMSTGGEGGMLTTNDPDLWRCAWSFKDHGKGYDSTYQKSSGHSFRWLHESFGTNWRMTEMQAALGRVSLQKLPAWVDTRRRHAAVLTDYLRNISDLRITVPPQHIKHAYYKYYIFVRTDRLKPERGRDWILAAINAEGVPCYSGSCSEIYLEKAFIKAGMSPTKRFPVAQELGETSLMFLVHPTLSMKHLKYTCEVVEKIMSRATENNINNQIVTLKQQL